MNALSSAALLAVLGFSSTAMAQLSQRCTVDDRLLNRTVAAGRNAWARKCGFISQAKQLFLNEEGEYQVFSNGCYAYPNVVPGSSCIQNVPISELAACIPLNALPALGSCPIGYVLSARGQAPSDTYLEPTEQSLEEVFSFKLANGHELDVPAHLLLVDGEGNLVKARMLAPGDELLGSDGQKLSISDINVSRFQGYIWDLLPLGHEPSGNTLDVGGVLTGSPRARSEWARINARLALREEVDVQGL
ncbi:hypothetical protein F0U62_03930 [Cystobacter fuscus]|uniref:Hint domain-containing protein n=1 Tax=Cystobacter fuscus TaxID=43 RepID=UPI002B2F9F23|nr:hypothetical protein F0U62_03930 [Cystobacter fuscus]